MRGNRPGGLHGGQSLTVWVRQNPDALRGGGLGHSCGVRVHDVRGGRAAPTRLRVGSREPAAREAEGMDPDLDGGHDAASWLARPLADSHGVQMHSSPPSRACARRLCCVFAAPTPCAAAKTMASQWWQLHGRGCLAWTGGGLIINELFKRFGSKRSQEVVAGSPRFCSGRHICCSGGQLSMNRRKVFPMPSPIFIIGMSKSQLLVDIRHSFTMLRATLVS